MISIIAAIGKNNELGKNNTLLWHIPADMKHFREITYGHPVIMGRKTFESIGKSLPNRKNIVITRDVKYKKDGAEVVHSLAEALDLFPDTNEEIFIIGGAEIYKQAMVVADRLYITHIEAKDSEADSFFPEIIPVVWNEVKHEEYKGGKENPFNYTFSIYKKN
ncbi:MAG: Dihydrofolate reductase [Parcubacteria group bacterium GW2011_GWB1_36_5]|nr:MAG: Dihydrofolate reductase [Parcubacteria group bacterium GW2011_GWA2_36_24]KKQ07589.1 MAG: Dihydrofolate reductase [Parcubacteria group bacterium GW2011_GWB1_36_5]